MEKDWRLSRDQELYLIGKTVKSVVFPADSSNLESHAHCEFCWATISPYAGDEHNAYRTIDGRFWICQSCFHDFRQMFGWKIETD